MAEIRDFLDQADYSRYRNVRAAALMFIVFGFLFTFSGVMVLLVRPVPNRDTLPLAVKIFFIVVGLSGLVGGFAARSGNRKWSRLLYVMAIFYALVFPIGTIMSVVMFHCLPRYLDSVERFRLEEARANIV